MPYPISPYLLGFSFRTSVGTGVVTTSLSYTPPHPVAETCRKGLNRSIPTKGNFHHSISPVQILCSSIYLITTFGTSPENLLYFDVLPSLFPLLHWSWLLCQSFRFVFTCICAWGVCEVISRVQLGFQKNTASYMLLGGWGVYLTCVSWGVEQGTSDYY